jgi:L-ascorbate metabolism protein UlaG (beta-lactamase superfamily)
MATPTGTKERPEFMTSDDQKSKPTRRRTLKWLGALGLTGAGGVIAMGRERNAYYNGPVSDHFDGTKFFNPGGRGPKGLGTFLKWTFATRAEAWPEIFASPYSDTPPARVDSEIARVTYIGHASFLVQAVGRNILIDPVYADRASPVRFAGPMRVNAPGIALDALPKIDAILVAHNHYDHMDARTLKTLWQRDRPQIITPLGNDTILKDAIDGLQATAVDWGHTTDLGAGLKVHTVPTQHWSARGAFDRMHALWASFVIECGARTIYAIGDTGFGDGSTFRAVRAQFPAIDLALLPIGAYEPRFMMADQHMNPEEAVKALELCGAKAALGHHWGTFKLTNEGIERPREHLTHALEAKSVAPGRFVAAQPGLVHVVA